jgi:DNA-binding FadR family transcriptional regulator
VKQPFIPRGERDGRKLAQLVAERLESEIIELGWPVGHGLGSEPELLARLGVSRAVLREAIRMLELHDVATMRRGPNGGLVIKEPAPAAAVRASALNLAFMKASPRDVFEARSVLELRCVELASQRIDEERIAHLRKVLADEQEVQEHGDIGSHDLHTALAEASGNPAFVHFVRILTQLSTGRHERSEAVAAEVRIAHTKIVEAVIAGDSAVARHRMQTHLAAIGGWMSKDSDVDPSLTSWMSSGSRRDPSAASAPLGAPAGDGG